MMRKSKNKVENLQRVTIYTLCIDTIKQLEQKKMNIKFIKLEIEIHRRKMFFHTKNVYIPISTI